MKRAWAAIPILGAVTAFGPAPQAAAEDPDFYRHWGDGRAEISSYRVVQPRYGEARNGYGVLIFVTEDINRDTYVKVESPTPPENRVYTLKLNNILQFGTGIYDYSVMTSVFSAVEPSVGAVEPFQPLRVTLTAQEWCGHVFEELTVRDGKLRGYLNSYFETEGRQEYEFDRPRRMAIEDHLLIRIRELKGPVMEQGEQRPVTFVPSLWQFRLQHAPRSLKQGTLNKGYEQDIEVGGRTHKAVPWRWEVGPRQKLVWVEKAYPHRILAWEDNRGASGELMKTIRQPYWSLKSNEDAMYRDRLGIP